MTDFQIELLGFVAAFLTTFGFVPQAIKIFKSKDTSSISLSMYVVLLLGVSLWLVYGILLQRPAIILANSVSMILQLWIIIITLKHR
ncbi:MAG: SemiSWEET transporter [Flavobacteriaceae bacterium]|jgi:MtN3 and saliva related transmembrane protein|nr:SemiSWEET transporter [Flavobacteriales bacterium]MDG1272690.1 SemiSWEET transporter [Flavobacteriaceae bacterium]